MASISKDKISHEWNTFRSVRTETIFGIVSWKLTRTPNKNTEEQQNLGEGQKRFSSLKIDISL
jgi:hypothetical protein